MIILTVVYNKPEFIPYQYECLKRYITVPFEFMVFDNADTEQNLIHNRNVCESLGVQYKRVPQDIHLDHNPSCRAGASLTYALQYVYQNLQYRGIVMVNDSDLFLTDQYNPMERLGSFDIVGRFTELQCSLNELETANVIRKIQYYNNQFLILNFGTLPNFKSITFMPGEIQGIRVDCGGLLHNYFEANPSVRHSGTLDICSNYYNWNNIDTCSINIRPFFEKELFITQELSDIPNGMNRGHSFSEIVDSVFLHLRAGSNWIQHAQNVPWQREQNLFQFLCDRLIDWSEKRGENCDSIRDLRKKGGKI
jgi:hypothetical protein